jgi:hypothetical protein
MIAKKLELQLYPFLLALFWLFFYSQNRELETIYKTKVERLTDTLYITSTDTVYIPKTKIKTEFLRDTILIDFKPQISRFETLFPFEHGSTKVSGEVLGEVLKMTATNEYKLPVVTNTIIETNTETIIKKSKGFYLGANVNSALNIGASAFYVDDKYLFSYQFQPVDKNTHDRR